MAVALLLWLAVTGLFLQGVDLYADAAPGSRGSSTVRADMREGIYGPVGFPTIRAEDFAAGPALPLDHAARLAGGVQAAAARLRPGVALTSLELRLRDDRAIGIVTFAGDTGAPLVVDAQSGAAVALGDERAAPVPKSAHRFWKGIHTGRIVGAMSGPLLGILAAVALGALALSGLWLYGTMLSLRIRKLRRPGMFWR